jgi:hypothetical protein
MGERDVLRGDFFLASETFPVLSAPLAELTGAGRQRGRDA